MLMFNGRPGRGAGRVNGSLSECRMGQPDTLMTFNDQQLARIGPVTLSVLRYSLGQMRFSRLVRKRIALVSPPKFSSSPWNANIIFAPQWIFLENYVKLRYLNKKNLGICISLSKFIKSWIKFFLYFSKFTYFFTDSGLPRSIQQLIQRDSFFDSSQSFGSTREIEARVIIRSSTSWYVEKLKRYRCPFEGAALVTRLVPQSFV